MHLRKENLKKYQKNIISFKHVLLTILFSLFSLLSSQLFFAQDSIPIAKDLTEEKDLEFQEFFFKALTQKATGNYKKAIENLEACNQIQPNNASVFFEFSKNYFSLNKNLLAKEYINRALKKEPKNIWMLTHLTSVLKKQRNFSEAIVIQKKIIEINPTKRRDLVQLYLQNNDYKNALSLLNILENEQLLTTKLKYLKASLEQRKTTLKKTDKTKSIVENDLFEQFNKTNSYKILENILKENKENVAVLLEYSKKGMNLFPAQPFVYLVNANVLMKQKKYKEAIFVLENGIDFVVDEKTERQFYKTFIEAYKGLGNLSKESEYTKKLKMIK